MDAIMLKKKEVFFNNLVLLGLDVIKVEKNHGITFNKDMFVLPNKKGYEIVSYFLFSKLSSATGTDYNIPWPLLSKEQFRAFQKTVYSHLLKFSQEGCVKFPRSFPSLQSTFGGDRFYEVYHAFSSYVLYKTIQKNNNVKLLHRPVPKRESIDTSRKILQMSTSLHIKRFRDVQRQFCTDYSIWLKFVRNLEECLKNLKCLMRTYEDLLKKNKEAISSLYTLEKKDLKLDRIMEVVMDSVTPVIKKRKELFDKFFASEEKYWSYLSSEIGENAENVVLNGQDYNIAVSENLPIECQEELRKFEYSSSEEDGILHVSRFIKLFKVYLTYVIQQFEKADIKELHRTLFVENASSIKDDLDSITKLNKKLSEEVIPQIQESIHKLKKHSLFDEEENLSPCNELPSSLPLLSFSDGSVKQRTSHFNPSLIEGLSYSCASISAKHLFCKKSHVNIDETTTSPKSCSTDPGISSSFDEHSCANNKILNDDVFSSIAGASNSCLSDRLSEKENLFRPPSISSVAVKEPSSNLKMDISELEDVDFEPSTHFKMRESWHFVESLHAATLPDMSFED